MVIKKPLLYSSGQTVATCQRNIPQHCWAQHVACIWPPCCDVLRRVGCCWFKFENGQIWANNTQHVTTCRNRVAKRTQHVAPNNVAICCVGMLRSFGRGLRKHSLIISLTAIWWAFGGRVAEWLGLRLQIKSCFSVDLHLIPRSCYKTVNWSTFCQLGLLSLLCLLKWNIFFFQVKWRAWELANCSCTSATTSIKNFTFFRLG